MFSGVRKYTRGHQHTAPFPRPSWPNAAVRAGRVTSSQAAASDKDCSVRSACFLAGLCAHQQTSCLQAQSLVTCHLFRIFERASPLEPSQRPPSCICKETAWFGLSLSPCPATRLSHGQQEQDKHNCICGPYRSQLHFMADRPLRNECRRQAPFEQGTEGADIPAISRALRAISTGQ